MNLGKPALWISIASALLVVAFVVWDSKKASPGPISAVHQHDPKLANEDCAACHGSNAGEMNAACGACHADVTQQLAKKSGFHGTLTADASRCGTCHPEHHGAEFQIVNAASFAAAGVPDRNAFRHEKLAFALVGKHLELTCKKCHEHADDVLLAKGCKRFLGKDQKCASCHEDPHKGKLPDCASCHGQEVEFKKVPGFKHPAEFPLTGSHAKSACVDCHAKDSAFAFESAGVFASSGKLSHPSRTCQDCHASPHAEPFLAAVANSLAVKNGAQCETCHSTQDASFHGFDSKMTKAMHALTGFALDAPHAELRCAQCHAANEKLQAAPAGSDATVAFRALHPGRKANDCKACHADVHGGQFDAGRFAGQTCNACHSPLAFKPPSFDVQSHEQTSFPLTGSHQAVACASCHTQPTPKAPRVFHGTVSDCASCHTDAHQGFFERPNTPVALRGETGCARCHTTDTFGDMRTKPFDHKLWTGFALENKHATAKCESCHPATANADATGRTFGRVADVFHGSPDKCVTCHADAHRGAFDGPKFPDQVDGAKDCARCHTTASFTAAADTFDHKHWTNFALTGAHAKESCQSCHATHATKDDRGRRFGFANERFPNGVDRCSKCHADPHAGEFDRPGMPVIFEGKDSCERCHTTETFAAAAKDFDHQRWTAYGLDGAHARVSCEKCHAPSAQPDDKDRRFGRALGTDCASCHADTHVGQFAVEGRTNCARCHSTATTFKDLRFDHQRDSRFKLDATHVKLDCNACHVPNPLPDGGSATRYKPLGTVCGDCHDPRAPIGRVHGGSGSKP